MAQSILRRASKKLQLVATEQLERFYIPRDKRDIKKANNLMLVPSRRHRTKGKRSYLEWGYVLGIFETLLHQHTRHVTAPAILDVGCGTGFLAVAANPLLQVGGTYHGFDVSQESIDFCKAAYVHEGYRFSHLDAYNAVYATDQVTSAVTWDLLDASFDLVTALSVWTHFNEADAIFYMSEVERVLKVGGQALITCFLLDDQYHATKAERTASRSKFHPRSKNHWLFEKPHQPESDWFTTEWAPNPETVTAITMAGLNKMLEPTTLVHKDTYTGHWRENPGIFLHDILVLEKQA